MDNILPWYYWVGAPHDKISMYETTLHYIPRFPLQKIKEQEDKRERESYVQWCFYGLILISHTQINHVAVTWLYWCNIIGPGVSFWILLRCGPMNPGLFNRSIYLFIIILSIKIILQLQCLLRLHHNNNSLIETILFFIFWTQTLFKTTKINITCINGW